MVLDPAVLLALAAFLVAVPIVGCAYWVWLDAKEAALQRKHEAEMADALTRSVRQARDDRGRYLTADPNQPE